MEDAMENENRQSLEALEWLLDPADIGVRYLAMRDLTRTDLEVVSYLQEKAHAEGPIATVLAGMEKEGYWIKPGPGYLPKYHSTVWSIILLSQLGASIEVDKRVATACSYLLEHALTKDGQFTYNGLASGTFDCLQGNLCAALLDLGCKDERLEKAFEWMARSVTGEGIAPMEDKTAAMRYYCYKCGPDFACGANNKQSCAWGAVKVMLAFSKWPKGKRTPLINRAINQGVDFLFSRDPAKADYPTAMGTKPSSDWWKFGFPIFYITDLLQNVEALVGLGYGDDPRMANSVKIIREKQDAQGRWRLEYNYAGKTWGDYGRKSQPNKWVTLRALRVLRGSG
jgi:hypothetical protein